MKRQTLNSSASLPLLLLLAAGGVVADEQATDQQQALGDAPAPAYTYNDDWGLVSAPPPQGPYNAINLDPRIPGQDLVAPMPMPNRTARPRMPFSSCLTKWVTLPMVT